MKIMMIAASDLPIPAYKGGATETLVSELLDQIAKQNNPDMRIDVYSHCVGENFFTNNVAYHFLPITTIEKVYVFMMRVLRLLLLKKIYVPDIFPIVMKNIYKVDFSQYDLVLLEGCMQQVLTTRKVYKGKLALHIHTVMTLTPDVNGAKGICKNCDWLIGNSEFCSSVLKSIMPENESKTITIKNCIRLSQFEESDESFIQQFRRHHEIQNNEKCVIYCGRLEEGKGVLELINAFKQSKINGRLIIVGSSWFSDNKKTKYISLLEDSAKDIKDKIIFTGYINHSDIHKYYRCADVCVMPSIYREAAGLVALEAQACGIPVIISDAGGIHEFVSPNTKLIVKTGDGFVDRLSNVLSKLMMNDVFYCSEKSMAQQNVKQFDISRYEHEFAKFFDRVICGRS